MSRLPKPLKYSPHYREHAEGHIYAGNAVGGCTITVTGAASMSQDTLDETLHFMVAAYNQLQGEAELVHPCSDTKLHLRVLLDAERMKTAALLARIAALEAQREAMLTAGED